VDRADAHPTALALRPAMQVDHGRVLAEPDLEAEAAIFLGHLGQAHGAGEERRRSFVAVQVERGAGEAADRVPDRDWTSLPWGAQGFGLASDQLERQPVGIAQRDHDVVEALLGSVEVDRRCGEAIDPGVDRTRRDAKRDGRDLTGARTPLRCDQRREHPGEERQDRARGPHAVAVVQVVGPRVVEVHGPLHEAQPEQPHVEVHVALRIAADRGDVVDAGNRARHRVELTAFSALPFQRRRRARRTPAPCAAARSRRRPRTTSRA
jgi:hypothetical protein